jgi:hypothetical protein
MSKKSRAEQSRQKPKQPYFSTDPRQQWLPFITSITVKPETFIKEGKVASASRKYIEKGGL